MILPPVRGEKISELELPSTGPGKTLVQDERVDMFLACDATRQCLRNAAHAFPLTFLTNPIWPVHDVILHDGEVIQMLGYGRFQRHHRRLTQDLFAAEA